MQKNINLYINGYSNTKYGIIHYKVSSNGFIQNKEFILDATSFSQCGYN